TTRASMGSLDKSMRTFPGRRVLPIRAWIIATVLNDISLLACPCAGATKTWNRHFVHCDRCTPAPYPELVFWPTCVLSPPLCSEKAHGLRHRFYDMADILITHPVRHGQANQVLVTVLRNRVFSAPIPKPLPIIRMKMDG